MREVIRPGAVKLITEKHESEHVKVSRHGELTSRVKIHVEMLSLTKVLHFMRKSPIQFKLLQSKYLRKIVDSSKGVQPATALNLSKRKTWLDYKNSLFNY